MNAVIVGNFGIQDEITTVDFRNDGKWYNYFTGDSITVENFQKSFSLAAGEFLILTTKKLPTPEVDILLNTEDIDNTPSEFSLSQNYPNPFNPSTTISYSIPSNIDYGGNVKLIVYDVLGRQVNTLVNQKAIPGEYSVIFEGSDLTSGIYFYTISVGEYYQTKKMILLK